MVRQGGSPVRAAAIVLGYALVHSALASRQAKDSARYLLGVRLRDGRYRFLFNAQAVLLFAWAARSFVCLANSRGGDLRSPASARAFR